jgi:hypothetical protein
MHERHMIVFHCDCGKELQVSEDAAGLPLRCPGCQRPVSVPPPTRPAGPRFLTAEEHALAAKQSLQSPRLCPLCGGRSRKKFPEYDTFWDVRFQHNRECQTCATVWAPACPRWGAYLCVVAGLLMVAGNVALVVWFGRDEARGMDWGFAMLLGLVLGLPGLMAVVYGLGVLTGNAGKLKILQRGG